LEADALHFSTDIWSSAVVILGLFCVKLGEWFGALKGFLNADSLAAILVALIVIQVSYKLGMRTVHSLLDTAPVGFEGKVIAAVEALTGVKNCHNVRARYSGSQLFVDVHVLVDGSQTLKEAHDLTDRVETAIQALESNVDVTVHAEPHSEIKAQGS
jgi:cation diffusion facilitator family transporter